MTISIRLLAGALSTVVLAAAACSDTSSVTEASDASVPSLDSSASVSDDRGASAEARIAAVAAVLTRFLDDLQNHPERIEPLESALKARRNDADANTLLHALNGVMLWRQGVRATPGTPPELYSLVERLSDLPYVNELAPILAGQDVRPPAASGIRTVRQALNVNFEPQCSPPAAPCTEQALYAVMAAVRGELVDKVALKRLLGLDPYAVNILACVIKGSQECKVADLVEAVASAALKIAFPQAYLVIEVITLTALARDAGVAWPTLRSQCEAHAQTDACQCLAPKSVCAGKCVDTSTEYVHCGSCSVQCVGRETCSAGTCTPLDGADAGQVDADQPDADAPDADQPDAGEPDAGQSDPDASSTEAGSSDAANDAPDGACGTCPLGETCLTCEPGSPKCYPTGTVCCDGPAAGLAYGSVQFRYACEPGSSCVSLAGLVATSSPHTPYPSNYPARACVADGEVACGFALVFDYSTQTSTIPEISVCPSSACVQCPGRPHKECKSENEVCLGANCTTCSGDECGLAVEEPGCVACHPSYFNNSCSGCPAQTLYTRLSTRSNAIYCVLPP